MRMTGADFSIEYSGVPADETRLVPRFRKTSARNTRVFDLYFSV